MHIKFDSLKTGVEEIVSYQNAVSVAKKFLFTLSTESNKFSTWLVLVDFSVYENRSYVQISLAENENVDVYFLITLNLQTEQVTVKLKNSYWEEKLRVLNNKNVFPAKGNVYKFTDNGYVLYIEDVLNSLIENGLYKMNNNTASSVASKLT